MSDFLFAICWLVAFAVPLGLAIWLSATMRDRLGWIAYGVLTVLFLTPAIILVCFFYPKVIDLTGPGGFFLYIFIVLFGFFWLLGSGIGFLFRGVRGAMQRAK